jgi:hypothetical protein
MKTDNDVKLKKSTHDNIQDENIDDSKTKDEELKKGDRVRFRRVVDPDDDKIVMVLLEDPDGGRVLVESLIWESLNPTRVLPTSELIKVCKTKAQRKLISKYKGCEIFQENKNGEDGLVAYDSAGNIVAWRFGVHSNDLNQVILDIEHFNETGNSKTKM